MRPLLFITMSLVALAACGDDDPSSDGGARDAGPGMDGGVTDSAEADAPLPDGALPDAGPMGDGGASDSGADAGTLVPTEFRGIPERPYAGVETPAAGTVELGATRCVGTREAPAFMIGDGTEFSNGDDAWEIDAQFCIIANVNYRGRLRLINANMVELRDSEIHHSTRAAVSISGTDVAIVNSHMHHARGNNGHGVHPNCGSSRIWVTGNLLEYNDEDGFQSGHQCGENRPDELYFYGNTCHNNRENCFDLKWTNRAVASGNVMDEHRPAGSDEVTTYLDGSTSGPVNSGSDGFAVVIGSDGTPNTTFMFDNIYNNNQGCVRVEDAVDVYASGELCSDALAGAGAGGYKFDKSGYTRLVDSTFDNVPFMITDNWREAPRIDVGNNTLAGGTLFRQGENATLREDAATDADVNAAYMSAFGRAP